jgi:hypothetical protein
MQVTKNSPTNRSSSHPPKPIRRSLKNATQSASFLRDRGLSRQCRTLFPSQADPQSVKFALSIENAPYETGSKTVEMTQSQEFRVRTIYDTVTIRCMATEVSVR